MSDAAAPAAHAAGHPAEPGPFRPVGPALRRLAAAHGVATGFQDLYGRHRDVSAATVEAVLAALGVDCSTPARVEAALADHRLARWRRTLPPVFVQRAGDAARCWAHVDHGTGVRLLLDLEDGRTVGLSQLDVWVEPVEVDGRLVGEATFAVPSELPLGWHTLRAELDDGSTATCPMAVTPRRLDPPALQHGRQWGFMTQVYAMRSARSWATGDLADLADLCVWSAAELGAGFVLVNPLHAASPVAPMAPSPYLPVTRRFASPLYLRVEEVPEFAYLPAEARAEVDALAAPLRAAAATADLLDRDAVWAAKLAALEHVYRVPRAPGRRALYDAFCAREGAGLADFATWCALAEAHGPDWSEWPAGLRDPASAAVAAERERLADRVDLHRWLQWLVDEQLRAAQSGARRAGMAAGIVHDLAVGVHPDGADAWALGAVLARDMSVGAPPDMYSQRGQDWSQPPWRPDALAAAGFAPYRDMLRTVLRHAGGIRVDHVMGLFRLWWVPRGWAPSEGTYVSYDHEALVGILALEAHRAGAVVVGEDLGTVEPWVRDVLRDRGVLGTSIMWFEHDDDGGIRPPGQWRRLCLGSVAVHDLPPTAGYLRGEHVRIRDSLGQLARPVAEEWADHAAETARWRAFLRGQGLLPAAPAGGGTRGDPPADGPADADVVVAMHRLLARTPCLLLGVGLPDAVGDVRAQNQPGTDQEYPNWRVPLCDGDGRAVLLEDLPASPLLRRLVQAVRDPG